MYRGRSVVSIKYLYIRLVHVRVNIRTYEYTRIHTVVPMYLYRYKVWLKILTDRLLYLADAASDVLHLEQASGFSRGRRRSEAHGGAGMVA